MPMIHELTVTAESTPAQVAKLARKLGMTGGYELVLESGLSSEALQRIYDTFLPELQKFAPGSSRFHSNNNYRILALLLDHSELSLELRDELLVVLERSG